MNCGLVTDFSQHFRNVDCIGKRSEQI